MLFDEGKYKGELKSIVTDRFMEELKSLRTGKATQEMFQNIMIDQYGNPTPIPYTATLKFDTPISVQVIPFNKADIGKIADAIRNANLGASVSEQSDHVRLNFPSLTQEDRANSVKILNKMLEEFRVRARNIRLNYKQEVDAIEGVSEDEQRASEKRIQTILDETIENLEKISKEKEKEINPNQ